MHNDLVFILNLEVSTQKVAAKMKLFKKMRLHLYLIYY